MIKKTPWFTQVRGSYLPCSWQGWVLYVPYIFFLVLVFVATYRNSHLVSDMIYGIFPQYVCATVVMTWIARQKS